MPTPDNRSIDIEHVHRDTLHEADAGGPATVDGSRVYGWRNVADGQRDELNDDLQACTDCAGLCNGDVAFCLVAGLCGFPRCR